MSAVLIEARHVGMPLHGDVGKSRERRERLLEHAALRRLQELVGIEGKYPVGIAGREDVAHELVAHHLCVPRRGVLVAEKDRQAFRDEAAQDVGRGVERAVVDDRQAVEHAEVVPDERLDDVRLVADLRRADQPHAVSGARASPVAMR